MTRDAFLGGRLEVAQPKAGYRAGADPVFLAAAVPAHPGQSVLELGCGSGVAMLCLMARVPELRVTGIERDEDAAELARANLKTNGFYAAVECADISSMPAGLRADEFDHVMTNPPFFDRNTGSRAPLVTREAGRGLDTALEVWVDTALRRLAPRGTYTMVNRIERLPDCLAALDSRVGDIVVKPLASRHSRSAKLFILQAKKGSKGSFRLLPPLVLHSGDRHERDGDSYAPEAAAILRNGAALTLSD